MTQHFSSTETLRDETRTSYLLQGVQSAWDSVGRLRAHRHPEADRGAAGGAAASAAAGVPREPQEEQLGGAAAQLDVPLKGNVSSASCRYHGDASL